MPGPSDRERRTSTVHTDPWWDLPAAAANDSWRSPLSAARQDNRQQGGPNHRSPSASWAPIYSDIDATDPDEDDTPSVDDLVQLSPVFGPDVDPEQQLVWAWAGFAALSTLSAVLFAQHLGLL
jgi:hypothetical protein